MSNYNAICTRIFGFIFVALIAVFGLASCGGGGATSRSAPSTSNTSPPPSNPNAPVITLSAGSTSIAYNASTTVTWSSTNSTSCVSTGGGGTGTSGSFNTGALTATVTYTVTCTGAGGSASKSVTITVAPSAITGVANTGGAGNVTFTSANNLAAGSIITISGTTNYNGTYTVLSATSTTFVIAHGYTAETFTSASWQLAGGMISGCSTSGDTTAIALSTVPSRFNGVAPLAVFFDASATTANATTKPFHDLEYTWDFGDSAGSPARGTTWSTGSHPGVSSRNSATGAEAAHVFESPGVYTVGLTATDGTNTVSNSCALIVVQDPNTVFAGTNTICVGANSAPAAGANGCPAGATTAQQASFSAALNTYAYPGKRVLFQRGDTFNAATSGRLNRTGPGIVGAFGSGSAPIVRMTGNEQILVMSSRDTPNIKDWRIMDLEFDGMSKLNCVGIDAEGGINQVLILNMNIHDAVIGIGLNSDLLNLYYLTGATGHAMFDEMAIVDSTITPRFNAPDGWEVYAMATRASIQGNTFGNMLNSSSMGSHVVRVPYMEKGVIANNTIARAGANQLAIKLHAQAWCESTSPAGSCTTYDNNAPPPTYTYQTNTHPIGIFNTLSGYTEKVIIADNKIIGADNPYTMSAASQNLNSDERLRDIIVERNWFISGTGTQLAILFTAEDMTIRNNIVDMKLGSFKTFASVFDPGTAPPSQNIKVLNNTVYAGAGSEFFGVDIHPTAINVSVINNLFRAPSSLNPVVISGTGASGLVQSNNILRDPPASLFVSADPVNPADFGLNPTSPAREAGLSTVPVRSDFFLTGRPQGLIDVGAIEGP
ncbi:MAG: PKD domain-containing protein [Nitrosomonadales bacterium]|nr:PKD domain-containing protein [Nitrosomonadales bacterium]